MYCGAKAKLDVGDVPLLAKITEGTVMSMAEEKAAYRGRLSRASGWSCMIVGHSDDGNKTYTGIKDSQLNFPPTARAIGGFRSFF